MSAFKKIAGLVAGASAVAIIGVATAQSVPPNPFVTNHAQAAGQQSTHLTWMGETGTPWGAAPVVTAEAQVQQQVAVAPAPEPAPIVAQAEPAQETQTMGAAPEPAPAAPAPRADRN